MRKFFVSVLLLIVILFTAPIVSSQNNSQTPPRNEFERGKVIKIIEQGNKKITNKNFPYQKLEIRLLTGTDKGKTIRVDYGDKVTIKEYQLLNPGDEVVMMKLGSGNPSEYFIQDRFRLPSLFIIFAGFLFLVILLSRLQGVFSVLGMLVSLAILIVFIVPAIARGADPVLSTLGGSAAIIFTSIFLAHGFNKRTAIAVGSTLITLVIAVIFSYLFAGFANLTGAGSEEAYSLQFGQFANVNLKGLLLAGIIIGTLGVLDDITTSLSATVAEISSANPKLRPEELYRKGISVGKEHIISLVNTLVLAYAGASMPIFLFFLAVKDTQPLWVTLNAEFIVEEVVRALVGSSALILAVPITTFLASAIYGNKKK